MTRGSARFLYLLLVGALLAAPACSKQNEEDDDDDDQLNNAPTISNVTVTPSFLVVGLGGNVTGSATATDPDGDSLTYSWEVTTNTGEPNAGGGRPAVTYMGANFTHTPPATAWGSQTVNLTVSDGKGGSATASRTFVQANINGVWQLRVPSVCPDVFVDATFTQTGNTFTGIAVAPTSACGFAAGSLGNTDPAVPATIDANGNIVIRWKFSFFQDVLFTGQFDTTTGKTITGTGTGAFGSVSGSLTKQ